MPAVVLESRAAGHAAVTRYQQFFEEVLATSPDDKELPLTESPTNNPSFDLLARHAKTALSRLRESAPNNETRHDDSENPKDKDEEKTRQFAMIETVARNLFNSLVVSSPQVEKITGATSDSNRRNHCPNLLTLRQSGDC